MNMPKKQGAAPSCALPEAEFNWLFGDDVDDETFGRRLRGIAHKYPDFKEKVEADMALLKKKFCVP